MSRHRRISPNHPSLHRPGQPPRPPRPRTLHLVDVDNLLGDPTTTDPASIDLVFRDFREVAGFVDGDHVVVATGRNAEHVLAVELAWPTARHCRQGGPDGADLALLDEAEWAARSLRYGRVVLGSGDRIFLAALDRLRAVDVHVDVVSRARGLARALSVRAAGHVHLLPERPGTLAA
jgi:hypothetical protein